MAVLAAISATVVAVVNHGMVNSRDPTQMLANGCSAVLLYLPLGFLYQVLGAAMVQATVEALLGRRPTFGRALRFAVRPAVLGALLLVQVCTIASAMVCLVPLLLRRSPARPRGAGHGGGGTDGHGCPAPQPRS